MPTDTPEPSRPDRDTTDLLQRPGACPEPELPCLDHLPPAELVEAVLAHQRRCWGQEERVPAARYLEAYPALRADPDAAADVVYQEYVLRAGGDDPDPFADYVRRYPQYAEALRGLHEADRIVQDLFLQGPPAAPPTGGPRRFRDYELHEEVGRGGMGVVWRATQVSLARPVALKMILAGELASAAAVERFHNEARAAAKLRHPNIVAIHEVGSEAGHHFFSMELVEGQTLAALVRESPLPADQAARYVEAVARAIHHAHQHGVLHRDLKPTNVIIDENDQPHVTDFGLARQVEADRQLTGTGQVLGTPSYMPPEQATGRRGGVGPASDVYSLGAVLYELLTGRPPFRAATTFDTLLLVVGTEPVPPRQLNPGIPHDLETVCLKCLHKEPRRRYPSAEELADDLARFRRKEPVRARPVGPAGRCWRWCRRSPVVAGLSAGLLATLIGGLGAVLWQLHRAERHRADAEKQRDIAQANLAKAQDAVDFLGRRIGQIRRPHVPQVEEVRREVLEYALKFHEGFLQERGDEPAVRWEAVKAWLRVGEARSLLGRLDQAEAAYRQAARLAEGLPEDFPGVTERLQTLMACYDGLYQGALNGGRLGKAAEIEPTIERLFGEYPPEHRGDPDYRQARATYLHNKSLRLHHQASPREAEGLCRQALAISRALVKEDPDNWRSKERLAKAANSLAIRLKSGGRLPEARQAYEEALTAQQQLVDRFPNDPSLRFALSTTCRNLGPLLRAVKEPDQARKMFIRAEAALVRLTRDFPNVPLYHVGLAETYHSWGLLRRERGPPGEALSLFEKAVASQRRALEPDPTNYAIRWRLCAHCYQIAELHLDGKHHEKAARAATEMSAVAGGRSADFLFAAGLFARCAAAAEKDDSLPGPRRKEVARGYAVQAVRTLRPLLTHDRKRLEKVAADTTFAPLLPYEDFRKFVDEVTATGAGK